MLARQNCWEAKSCGREPGGAQVAELGVCPAATDASADGANGGRNGGRLCWAISGTFCGGVVQGTGSAKKSSCLQCDFFEKVMREESMGGSMPTEMVDSWSRRLFVVAIVCVITWGLYTALGLTLWAERSTLIGHAVAFAATGASVALAVYVRAHRPTHRELVLVGFAFEAAMGMAISIGEFSVLNPSQATSQVSWTCVLLLFFPLLVPATPRATLIGSSIVAATSPVGYLINLAAGAEPMHDAAVIVSRFLPQLICVGLAYIAAHALHRLTSHASHARRLGSYELVERLGGGGMGEVWRARHRMLVRPAAVKIVRGDRESTERLAHRFGREAQATSALESPHTVSLYDFGVADDGTFYYAMELLQGIDMQRLIERFGPQPAGRVVYLLRQVCDSLDDAHRIGLVHRDVKPANIFIAIKGRRLDFVKVLDFGLVKSGHDSGDVGVTAKGEVIGTPAYLAPEMITAKKVIDGRTDMYGLGCVAYWLLTGKPVFEGATPMEVAVSHAALEPVPPSERLGAPVPAALEELVMRCLSKDPSGRPDAREAGKLLGACAPELGEPWTADRARDWWESHLPETLAGAHVPIDQAGSSSASLYPV